VDTVIVPAYFPLVAALLVVQAYKGNIHRAAILLLIFWLVGDPYTPSCRLLLSPPPHPLLIFWSGGCPAQHHSLTLPCHSPHPKPHLKL
jgi:hypothetical protein